MARRRMNPITRAKRAIARKTGVPTTKSGRVRKARRIFGHAATGGNRAKPSSRVGCLTIVIVVCLCIAAAAAVIGAL